MDALSQMVDDYETQLKFVVTDASDLPQITDLVDRVRKRRRRPSPMMTCC